MKKKREGAIQDDPFVHAYFEGIVYPTAIEDGDYRVDMAELTEFDPSDNEMRRKVYNSDYMKLSKSDAKFADMKGLPIQVEHRGSPVGRIIHNYVNSRDQLCIIAKVTCSETAVKVRNKEYNKLSISFSRIFDEKGSKKSDKFREVSLVEEPFFDDCVITCTASAKPKQRGWAIISATLSGAKLGNMHFPANNTKHQRIYTSSHGGGNRGGNRGSGGNRIQKKNNFLAKQQQQHSANKRSHSAVNHHHRNDTYLRYDLIASKIFNQATMNNAPQSAPQINNNSNGNAPPSGMPPMQQQPQFNQPSNGNPNANNHHQTGNAGRGMNQQGYNDQNNHSPPQNQQQHQGYNNNNNNGNGNNNNNGNGNNNNGQQRQYQQNQNQRNEDDQQQQQQQYDQNNNDQNYDDQQQQDPNSEFGYDEGILDTMGKEIGRNMTKEQLARQLAAKELEMRQLKAQQEMEARQQEMETRQMREESEIFRKESMNKANKSWQTAQKHNLFGEENNPETQTLQDIHNSLYISSTGKPYADAIDRLIMSFDDMHQKLASLQQQQPQQQQQQQQQQQRMPNNNNNYNNYGNNNQQRGMKRDRDGWSAPEDQSKRQRSHNWNNQNQRLGNAYDNFTRLAQPNNQPFIASYSANAPLPASQNRTISQHWSNPINQIEAECSRYISESGVLDGNTDAPQRLSANVFDKILSEGVRSQPAPRREEYYGNPHGNSSITPSSNGRPRAWNQNPTVSSNYQNGMNPSRGTTDGHGPQYQQ